MYYLKRWCLIKRKKRRCLVHTCHKTRLSQKGGVVFFPSLLRQFRGSRFKPRRLCDSSWYLDWLWISLSLPRRIPVSIAKPRRLRLVLAKPRWLRHCLLIFPRRWSRRRFSRWTPRLRRSPPQCCCLSRWISSTVTNLYLSLGGRLGGNQIGR